MSERNSPDISPHKHIKTEAEVLFNEELCRICLQKGSMPIYGIDDAEDKSLDLSFFASIEISEVDPYPKYLCESCDSLLQSAILLRETAQKTQKILNISNKTERASVWTMPIFASYRKKYHKNKPTHKKIQLNQSHNIEPEFSFINIKKETDIFNQEESNNTELLEMGFKESIEDELLEMDLERLSEDDFDFSDMNFKIESDISDMDMDFDLSITDNKVKQKVKRNVDYLNCDRCDLKFNSLEEIREHKETPEHVNKKVTCTICNKLIKYTCFKGHMQIHSDKPRFVCDICGKHFVSKHVFYTHRMIHTNYLPVKCNLCPYRGRNKEALKSHMRRHTGEKPYQCGTCLLRFLTNSNLHKHMRSHKTERDFKCDYEDCTKAFHTKPDLQRHIKVVHAGILDFKCMYCNKAFGNKKPLRRHELKVHKRSKFLHGVVPLYLRGDIKKQSDEIDEAVQSLT